jgi:DtxR family transcriptional regulator, Mn-dependent transcriptional regulator
MPTSTVEDYLKQILLEEQGRGEKRVPTGRLAQALAVTPGTVTAMVKALSESGLVDYEAYGGVRLTKAGRQLALHVLRRHRLIELFLVRIMGMDWSEVHGEADRLEHAVSDRLIERIDEMLGRPAVDPHGDPIPTVGGDLAPAPHETLAELAVGGSGRVARIVDQEPGFLRLVERLGLRPGTRVKVIARDEDADTLEIQVGRGARAGLGLRAAAKILVELD